MKNLQRGFLFLAQAGKKNISRVLSRTQVSLQHGDDHSSGTTVACRLKRRYPRTSGGPPLNVLLFGLAPDGVYHAFSVTRKAVSSYLAISPLPAASQPQAVYFLWHFPWGHPRSLLATTLPCGARTFLRRINSADDHLVFFHLAII